MERKDSDLKMGAKVGLRLGSKSRFQVVNGAEEEYGEEIGT